MSDTVSSQITGGLPAPVAQVAEAMSSYPAHWALCGGWAVDAWLGRHTREHADVDLTVFVRDQRALFEHLRGWQLVGHDQHHPVNGEPWDGLPFSVPGHFHGRVDRGMPPAANGIMTTEEGWFMDIQLNDGDDDGWVLTREPLIIVPLSTAVRTCRWGVPAVVPEVLLFYKAQDLRRRDKLDFLTMLPTLDAEQRAWLHDALARCGHPWLAQLTEGAAAAGSV